jgi:hypothetical protein
MLHNRSRQEDLDDDIEGDLDDSFDEYDTVTASDKGAADTQKKPVATGFLADDWLRGLAQGLDPGKNEEKHLWTPQEGPQSRAFNNEADELFYGGSAGGGKGNANSSLISTPFGWKKMGDIRVGDQVSNPDGSVARVIQIHPLGEQDIYEVTFVDGAKTKVTGDHLWNYWLAGKKIKADRKHPVVVTGEEYDEVKWVDHPSGSVLDSKVATTLWLKEYLAGQKENEKNGKRPYWPIIPLTEPVTYTRPSVNRQGKTIRIDPYLLGLLLGDGCITGNAAITIATTDRFIVDEVIRILGESHVYYDGKINIRLKKVVDLEHQITSYGLMGTYSDTKFIPENYLYSNIETRFNLMQGLIDTDGYVDDRGHVSYTTVSERLAKDVQQLARSLGARATITEKEGSYVNSMGVKVECKLAYTVYFQGKHVGNFMRLPRKAERYKPYNGDSSTPGRRIISIELAGRDEATCITVDHWNSLYIADDFIVTHNCLTADHEVLTKHDGWKPIASVEIAEQVASMGDNNSLMWQPVTETITELYKGFLYTYEDNNISFKATPNHKLVVNNGNRSSLIPLKVVAQSGVPINLYDENGSLVGLDVDALNREFYNGDVFCINVPPYHNFIVRRNGRIHVTGNSDLMLGLALSDLSPHKKAIIFRRSYPELKDIVTRAKEILSNTEAVFRGGNAMRFDRLPYGKTLELGSVPTFASAQKYKGRPHDLKLFDELSDIGENVYTFLIGWARTAEPGVPVRVVSAGNPPTNSDGEWVIRRWGAWLDNNHPNPALPGELRWYATLDGDDREITPEFNEAGSRGEPFEYTNRIGEVEVIKPKSRTFIPARLDDNKYLRDTDYKSILQNMPEPYRSQLLYGDFSSLQRDDPWQVIPTEWVRLSQKRWLEASDNGELQRSDRDSVSFGVDVAEGGGDYTVFTMLTGKYLQWIEYVKEEDTMKQVEMLIQKMKMNKRSPIGVDAIGVGLGMAQRLGQLGFAVAPIKVSRESRTKDITGNFTFANLRSELWWRLREAFDPDGDIQLTVPVDKRLFGDLIAPKYSVVGNGVIRIERQDQIRAKIGRSPDAANSLMMALYVQKKRQTPLRMA